MIPWSIAGMMDSPEVTEEQEKERDRLILLSIAFLSVKVRGNASRVPAYFDRTVLVRSCSLLINDFPPSTHKSFVCKRVQTHTPLWGLTDKHNSEKDVEFQCSLNF